MGHLVTGSNWLIRFYVGCVADTFAMATFTALCKLVMVIGMLHHIFDYVDQQFSYHFYE